MAYVSRAFTKYVVYYISGNSPQIGVPQDIEIDLFDDDWKRAGAVYFYPDTIANLPQCNENINGIYLYFRTSRFNDVMTMLKDEKPLTLYFNQEKKHGYILANEQVGGHEGL
jgi:hypothetical protein